MTDRVSSENDGVETVRAKLTSAGATGRPRITIPEEAGDSFPTGELVRVVLDGKTYHAQIHLALDDSIEIRGAYDNRRLARESEGENRLVEWADRSGLDVGRSVLVDVVDAGAFYGVRAPGTTAVYDVPKTPDAGLQDIAEDVSTDGRGGDGSGPEGEG